MAVTGDHGSSRVRSRTVVPAWQGLRDGAARHGATVERPADDSEAAAVAAARQADVAVVVVGLGPSDEGEYIVFDPEAGPLARRVPGFGGPGDRTDLGLRSVDVALIEAVTEANPKTIVVVVGSALAPWGWLERPAAVLYTFYAGMEGGHALARLLWGEVSPSGKLPFAIPADSEDLPPFDPTAATVEYGPYHGYTLLDRHARPALLPFGHGLSYTRFEHAAPGVLRSRIGRDQAQQVEARVTNVGEREGAEVVQLYVTFPQDGVERPLRLLRGFEKVWLRPGESQVVRFELAPEAFAVWDEAAHAWVVPPGTYGVQVGGSSDPAALLSASFEVA